MELKGKKLFASIVMTVVTLCIFLGTNISYADVIPGDFWVDINEKNSDTAYGIGNPTPGQGGEHIWKLLAYSSQEGLESINKKIYCVKAGVGETWNNSDNWSSPLTRRVNYKNGFDLKAGKSEIESFVTNPSKSIYKDIVTGENYKQILWIIDNMYIPGSSNANKDKENLLNAAADYYGIDLTSDYYATTPLTDADIEAVQQLALWYYTNHDEEKYTKQEEIQNVWINNSITDNSWVLLSDFHKNPNLDQYGPKKVAQMEALYTYLLNSAEANKSNYIEKDASNKDLNELKEPLTINEDVTITAEERNNDYYKVGPINITRNNSLPYSIDLKVTNGSGTEASNVSYIYENGSSVNTENIIFSNNTAVIYAKVPKLFGNKINIDIDVNYRTSTATYWLPPINQQIEQPIIEVNKKSNKKSAHLQTEVPDEKPFDLSLRKFITQINHSSEGLQSRIPQFGNWSLDNGNTIEKAHSKNRLKVATNDIVLYTIRIYNEGEVDGKATKITDYLPEGLEFLDNEFNTVTNGWSNPSGDGKTYVTEKLKNQTISAYDGSSTPKYKDVQIECRVKATRSSQGLKNIAEITEDYNEKGIQDRDSRPDNLTSSQKGSYNPSTAENGKGYEDDDDYEDLELKKFDLRLRKFITAISSDTTITDEDYVASRVPQFPGTWGTGRDSTTLNVEHDKNPLPVKQGDYVLYTIRVYNEGEVDGYASLIKDSIPEGLVMPEELYEHPINAQYEWNTTHLGDGYITTDYLAKGHGPEKGYSEGDQNYTANLINALVDSKNPDYREVKVLLKVSESNESKNIIDNRAEIADDSDENGNSVEDIDSIPNEWNEFDGKWEDDQDHDPVILQCFDLSLRKFIDKVDGKPLKVSRDPTGNIDASGLVDGTAKTAQYNHTKEPLEVNRDSVITYKINVYNEGDVDGYASKITDHLPEYLEFITDSSVNMDYGWEISEDGRTATTTFLAPVDDANTDREEKRIAKRDGETLSYRYVYIECKIKDNVDVNKYITNIAEISKYQQYINDANKPEIVKDRDSFSDSLTDDTKGIDELPSNEDLPGYKEREINSGNTYIEGQEDDDDFEKIVIVKKVDLALTKFITAVSVDENIQDGEYLTPNKNIGSKTNEYIRATVADTRGLKAGTSTNATYTERKNIEPLSVGKNSYVLYNIRVYNEGEADVYAGEVTDYLPENLEFVNGQFNSGYGWTAEGQTVKTSYLSKANGEDKILKAFDKENDNGAGSGLDYKDLPILCKVSSKAESGKKLINTAEITKYEDENGNEIPKDIDSTPENKDPKNVENRSEDDDDYEEIIIPKVDLALTKFITAVSADENIQDGEYLTPNKNIGSKTNEYIRATVADTRGLKAETSTNATYTERKNIEPLVVGKNSYVLYNIRVYNEGETDAFAGEVTDYLPENLEFVNGQFNNGYGWTAEGQTVKTSYLSKANGEDKILKAFDKENDNGEGSGLDYKDLPILCRVSSKAEGGKKLINTAEITKYEDENGNEIPEDIDSTPENKDPKNVENRSEDDDDYEEIVIPKVDLALTKFITAVSADENIQDGEYLTPNKNIGSKTNEYIRATVADTRGLKAGTSTNATYTERKNIEPLSVGKNSYVLYNIRVYNEGEVDVFAGEVTDYLPENLEFVNGQFNSGYGWTAEGQTVKTSYLSKANGEDKILKAFDKENDNGEGSGLDYKDLPILCKVSDKAEGGKKLINTAEITKYEDENGNEIPDDIDSTPENKDPKNEEHRSEDDDDYEEIIIPKVDLALTKFITAISADENIQDGEFLTLNKNAWSETNPYTRQTNVDTTELKAGTSTDAVYTRVKDPLTLNRNSYVLYNIRVYNEGEVDVFAGEVTDYLPENLDFVNGQFNSEYGWTAEGQTVRTSYLSKANGEDKILKAFDKEKDDRAGSGLSYKDLPILCQINSKTPTNKELINTAEITKYEDKDGNEIPSDVDSTSENKKTKNDKNREEDDDDYEVVMVQEFDLSLVKYVSQVQVTENGKTVTTNTNNTGNNETDIIPKVEIHKKKLSSTIVKFIYTIKVTNEGDIAGYAKEVTDYVPVGLKFVQADNPNWTLKSEGVIATRALENTLLQPGDSAPVTVVFTWINGSENLGLKHNIAEISEDYNEEGVPDKDSTPNNRIESEDDQDYADVLLSIKTGKAVTYILLVGSVLIVLASGIVLIRKYVL